MRYVGEISNEPFKIGLYTWNGKFIVKVETPHYEQIYKISEMDFLGSEDDIRQLFSDQKFLKTIADRFGGMHQDLNQTIDNHGF
jgi:hypothetical protein